MAHIEITVTNVNINNHDTLNNVFGEYGFSGCYRHVDFITVKSWQFLINEESLALVSALASNGFEFSVKQVNHDG